MKKMYLSKDGLTLRRVTKNSKGDIVVPEGVVYLAKRAMAGCEFITEVSLPSTLKELGEEAFEGCTSLTKIKIPEGVEIVPRSAFRDCSDLATISLPSTLNSIEKEAFASCSSLTRIEIPDAVDTIGAKAFSYCTSFEEVVMPAALTKLGEESFCNCSTLKEIDIPLGVETIPESCFKDCTNLNTAIFHDGLKVIENHAFERCSIKHIEICSTIEKIGTDAFFWNVPDSIIVDSKNKTFCDAGSNVIMENETGVVIYGSASSTIPVNATIIGYGAFQKCPSILVIPPSVKVIQNAAFLNCPDGCIIILQEGVTTIEWGAFQQKNGAALTVYLPSSVNHIEGQFSTVEFHLDAANPYYSYDVEGHNIISKDGILVWGHLDNGIPNEGVYQVEVVNYGRMPYSELSVPDNVRSISYSFFRLLNDSDGFKKLKLSQGTILPMALGWKTKCEISVTIPREKSKSGITMNTEYIIPKGTLASDIFCFLGSDSIV